MTLGHRFSEPDFTCTRRLPGRDSETGICGTCQAPRGLPHEDRCRRYELENPRLAGRYWGVRPADSLGVGAAMVRLDLRVHGRRQEPS